MLLENKYFMKLEKSLCLFRYIVIFITFFNLEQQIYLNEILFGRINSILIFALGWTALIYAICKRWGKVSKGQYYLGLLEWFADLVMIDSFAYVIGGYGNGFIYVFMIILSIIAFVRYQTQMITLVLVILIVGNTLFIYRGFYAHAYFFKDQNMYTAIISLIFIIYLFYHIYEKQEKLEQSITRLQLECKNLQELNKGICDLYTMNTKIYQNDRVENLIEQLLKNIYKVVQEVGIGVILYDENGIESNSKMYTYNELVNSIGTMEEGLPFKVVYAQKEIEIIREYKEYKNCILNCEPIVLSNMPKELDYTYTILPGTKQKYIYMFNLMKDNRECGIVLVNVERRLDKMQCTHINEIIYHAGISLFKLQKLEMEYTRSIYDHLTEAKTRRYMEEMIPHYEKNAKKTGNEICIMFIDIDHFKQFNDQYGHATGDLVLKLVSKVMKEQLPKESLIIRYGGEEFVVLLPSTDRGLMEENARNLCKKIAQYNLESITNKETKMTVSIGVAFYPADGKNVNEAIKRADEAMYKVKQTTRNNVYLYNKVDDGGVEK